MARAKQPKPVHQLTVDQFEKLFPNEEACKAYLVARRWPEGVCCPRCGNPAVYDLPSRKWHWQCTQCAPGGSTGYRFSHLAGTIFENTNKPLRDWYRVVHLMLASKKGMSALQIYRYMGFGSYKTAWLMCHKVRVALTENIDKLGGIVEVDETFVGGLAKNRHWDKRGGGGGTGGIGSGKTPIVGAVSRKGNVVARVIANVQAATLNAFVRETVSHKVSLLCTDQWTGYKCLDGEYPHATVDHARGEYSALNGDFKGFKEGEILQGHLFLVNIGGTSATIEFFDRMFYWTQHRLPMRRPYEVEGRVVERLDLTIHPMVIPAGGGRQIAGMQSTEPMGPEARDVTTRRNNWRLYVMGRIRYRDEREVHTHMRFCQEWHYPDERFRAVSDDHYESECY